MYRALDDSFDFLSPLMIVIYVIVGLLIVGTIIFFILRSPKIKTKIEFSNERYRYIYYKKVKEIANKYDFYLVNNVEIDTRDEVVCKIDHILFANKYIYVIKDRYYRGTISGEKANKKWYFHPNDNEVFEMDSPLLQNQRRVDHLAAVTAIDRSFFISIVIINDNCVVKSNDDLNSENSFIVSLSQLPRLIKFIESRKVMNLNQSQLEKVASDIAHLYGQSKYKNEN